NRRYPLDPSNRRVSVLVTPREVERQRLEESEGGSMLDEIGSGMLNGNGGGDDADNGSVDRGNGGEGDDDGGETSSEDTDRTESGAGEDFDPEELDRRLRRALQ
ncbi:MAG: hypothetical protein ACOCUJ_03960, partial [Thiohalospira sp.]